MAVKEMDLDDSSESLGGGRKLYAEETVTGAVNSDWIIYPDGCKTSVILTTDGTTEIEITNTKLSNIIADTVPAGSIASWDLGSGGGTRQSEIRVCAAFRIKNTTGTSTMYASATRIQGNA